MGYTDWGKEEGAALLCGGSAAYNDGLAGGLYIKPPILKGGIAVLALLFAGTIAVPLNELAQKEGSGKLFIGNAGHLSLPCPCCGRYCLQVN